MRLGIDFGTTRTIVAYEDRGNYPVVTFVDEWGDAKDYLPSVAAWDEDELRFGFEALAACEQAPHNVMRSFKRLLSDPHLSIVDSITLGGRQVGAMSLLTGYASAVREALLKTSSVSDSLTDTDPLVAVIAVPAHAMGLQRFLTLEAFRRAGFDVIGMMNEPSAAGFEYTHRQGRTLNSKRTQVVVYDLGGGTFDASLVSVEGTNHDVLGSVGINRLGGDDFDEALAQCALARAGLSRPELSTTQWQALLDQCRDVKERLSPQTRRLAVDIDGTPADVLVDDFYAAVTGLVESTISAIEPLCEGLDDGDGQASVAGIYLVGGASGLPLVPRLLRARFGRRVHRSPHPAASTAIGLAIAGDESSGYSLSDQLSRGFGVYREHDSGRSVAFDPLLTASERVSPRGQSHGVSRTYRAAHNVGWFRFIEYTHLDEHHQPTGDLAPFAEVLFPFDPALQGCDLTAVTVQRMDTGPLVEETYTIDPHGIVHVTITDLDSGYRQQINLSTGSAAVQ